MKFVRDVSSRGLVAVPPTLGVTTLAQILERHQITGVPVVDDQGVVLGVVTQTDLVRALLPESTPKTRARHLHPLPRRDEELPHAQAA